MPAQTATDYANMLAGSDFTVSAELVGSDVAVSGVLTRNQGDALDMHGDRLRLIVTRVAAVGIAVDSQLVIGGTTYTVREKQPADHGMLLVLEET